MVSIKKPRLTQMRMYFNLDIKMEQGIGEHFHVFKCVF